MSVDFLTPEVQEVALSLMAGLNCARSLTVAVMIREREWEQLVKLKCNPTHYSCADSYLRAAAATDFLRKLDSSLPSVDREAATFEKWLQAEQECFRTNKLLYEFLDFGTIHGSPAEDAVVEFFDRLRKNLLWLIGSGPDPSFDGRFGPGATMSDMSGRTTVPHKMSTNPTLTTSALYYMVPWTGTKWAAACAARGDEISIVRGNSYFTVNKTALTHRPCAKEPSLNGYYQLGLGRELRNRLKGRGIDLDDGQDVHRRVACAASQSGEFCTIDLTSASDTLCHALVKLALPPKWFDHLMDLRSPFTRVNGRWYRLEKFSSMGNGFTFELETAIFTAICMALDPGLTPGEDLWVYGDDIIVPTRLASSVLKALRFCGFTPNSDKTYISGSFRESCGGDYWDGQAVRPYYLKELPNEPQHFIALANGIRRLASNFGQGSRLFADLRRTWFKCLDFIPSAIRQCRGPEQLGDLVIHDAEERWKTRWRANCIRYVRVYRPCSFRGVSFARFDANVQLATALYGVFLYPSKPKPGWPDGYDNRMIIGRDGVSGYKVGWLPYS